MEDTLSVLRRVAKELLAGIREEDQKVLEADEVTLTAAESKRQAEAKRERLTAELRIVRTAKIDLEALADWMTSDSPVVGSGAEKPVGMGHAKPWEFDRVFTKFLAPDLNEKGEPVYDARLLDKCRTHRERAVALARVHGPEIKESALADVIFRSGQTTAANVKAVRSALSGLARYGQKWTRTKGWLVYVGDLEPNRDQILMLVRERTARRRLGTPLGDNAEDGANMTQTSGAQ